MTKRSKTLLIILSALFLISFLIILSVFSLSSDSGTGLAFPERDGEAYLEKKNYPDALIDKVVDKAPLMPDEIEELSKSKSLDVRYLVASNPHLTEEQIDIFINDEEDVVRSGASTNPSLSDNQIEQLMKDVSHTVYSTLAANPALSEEQLLRLHQESDPGLLWFAKNPNCPESIIKEIKESDEDFAKAWLEIIELWKAGGEMFQIDEDGRWSKKQ